MNRLELLLSASLVLFPSLSQSAEPSCQITFRLGAHAGVQAAVVNVVYEGAPGEFPGDSVDVECDKVNDVGGVQADDDEASTLRLTVSGPADSPQDFAVCTWTPTSREPVEADFDLTDQEAFNLSFQPIDPKITISDIECTGTVTTTTLSSQECGDVNGNGEIQASDALGILRSGVGQIVCELCVCDLDGNGSIAASDSLRALRSSVGQPVVMACPACG